MTIATTLTICDRCKTPCVPNRGALGYGHVDANGRQEKWCYHCCAANDRNLMELTGRATLYLAATEVINWPGTLRHLILKKSQGRHNIAGNRTDVWFRDRYGALWHGVSYGSRTNICHCRRLKNK